jgi:hypothetical protein
VDILRAGHWEFVFFPKKFALDNMIEDLEEYRLPESVLRQYARQVTGLREKQRQRALKVEDSLIQGVHGEVQQISKLATKM